MSNKPAAKPRYTVSLNVCDFTFLSPELLLTSAELEHGGVSSVSASERSIHQSPLFLRWQRWLRQASEMNEDAKSSFAPEHIACIPASLRRRMSPLLRAAVSTALLVPQDTHYAIFSSRFADAAGTLKILETLTKGGDVSPSRFSHSVHNAAAGLFTIASKRELPFSSISAGADSFESACVEASAYLANCPDAKVLLVDFDAPLPRLYASFYKEKSIQFPTYALAMVVSAGEDLCLSRQNNKSELDSTKSNNANDNSFFWPGSVCFLNGWLRGSAHWRVGHWRWKRHD